MKQELMIVLSSITGGGMLALFFTVLRIVVLKHKAEIDKYKATILQHGKLIEINEATIKKNETHIKSLESTNNTLRFDIERVNRSDKGKLLKELLDQEELIRKNSEEFKLQLDEAIEKYKQQLDFTEKLENELSEKEKIITKLENENNNGFQSESIKKEIKKLKQDILLIKSKNLITKEKAEHLEKIHDKLTLIARNTLETIKTFELPRVQEGEELIMLIPSDYRKEISARKVKHYFDCLKTGFYVLLLLIESEDNLKYSQTVAIHNIFEDDNPHIMKASILTVKKYNSINPGIREYLEEIKFYKV